jgi:hypothetical protein
MADLLNSNHIASALFYIMFLQVDDELMHRRSLRFFEKDILRIFSILLTRSRTAGGASL